MELWNWKIFVGAVESAVVINTGLILSTSIKVTAFSQILRPTERIYNLQNGKKGIKSLGGRHNYQGRNIQIWSGKVKKENSKTAITIESETHHFQPLISMFSISGLCWNADKLIWLISSRVFVTFDAITTPLVKQFFGAHDSFEFLVDTIVSAIIRNSSWLGLFSCMDKLRKSFPFGLSRKPCLQKPHIPEARKISASEFSSFVAKIPRNCRPLAVFQYVKYVSLWSWPLTPKYRALSCFHLIAGDI